MQHAAAVTPEDQHFTLASSPPGPAQKRFALVVGLGLLAVFILITAGPLFSPNCQGDNQPKGFFLLFGKVALKLAWNPWFLPNSRKIIPITNLTALSTKSGAKGNDVTHTHGEIVPSSGPNGAPRAS